jgi:hypothetical protein
VPRLVSAGIAESLYTRAADYSSTSQRRRVFWLEFDRPPDDSRDAYFCRVLAYAPDPVLLSVITDPNETPEPPLPIDPEPIRTIIPGQSDDQSGLNAMQLLTPSASPRHFAVPLPSGIADDSPELFGFYTYELRVGHEKGWSTSQGRFGAPLRVTGVQHRRRRSRAWCCARQPASKPARPSPIRFRTAGPSGLCRPRPSCSS